MKLIRSASHGFTLVELAIVLIIVTLLTTGLITSLSAQRELAASAETQRRLNDAREALIGFASANGRLPCPATGVSGTLGVEDTATPACSAGWTGFLPAVTLGLSPTDSQGYALDAWNNRIRYALTNYANATYTPCASPNYCFAVADGIKGIWPPSATAPDLQICNTATGITGSGGSAACASTARLATTAVAVIYSRGANGAIAPTSADELANGDTDRLFVSHPPTAPGANEFDDLVVWLSPNILYNRMIAAGRLP